MKIRGAVLLVLAMAVAFGGAACDAEGARSPDGRGSTASASPRGNPTSPAPEPSSSTPEPSSPSPRNTPDVPPPTAPGDVLAEVTESGGIDGRENKVTVRVDGQYTVVRRDGRSDGRMAAADVRRLRDALIAVRFNQIDASDQGWPKPRGADMITYFVEYQGRDVVLGEGWDIPGMQDVLDALPPMNP